MTFFGGAFFRGENKFYGVIFGKITNKHKFWDVLSKTVFRVLIQIKFHILVKIWIAVTIFRYPGYQTVSKRLSPETLSRSVQLTIVSPKRTKMQKTRLPQFARNANVISQGLAWTALERCEDGE